WTRLLDGLRQGVGQHHACRRLDGGRHRTAGAIHPQHRRGRVGAVTARRLKQPSEVSFDTERLVDSCAFAEFLSKKRRMKISFFFATPTLFVQVCGQRIVLVPPSRGDVWYAGPADSLKNSEQYGNPTSKRLGSEAGFVCCLRGVAQPQPCLAVESPIESV